MPRHCFFSQVKIWTVQRMRVTGLSNRPAHVVSIVSAVLHCILYPPHFDLCTIFYFQDAIHASVSRQSFPFTEIRFHWIFSANFKGFVISLNFYSPRPYKTDITFVFLFICLFELQYQWLKLSLQIQKLFCHKYQFFLITIFSSHNVIKRL